MSRHSRARGLGRPLAPGRRIVGGCPGKKVGRDGGDSGGTVLVLAQGLRLGMGSGQGEWGRGEKQERGQRSGRLDSCAWLWLF